MERMTRNEAAAYLGVDAQTISNWVNKGLLGGINDKESKRVWVNANDVKKYAEKYKMLSVTEEMLDKEQKDLVASERKVDAKLRMLMRDALNISCYEKSEICSQLSIMWKLVVKGCERETKIMEAFFNGEPIARIAETYCLSRERIRQIVIKCIRKLILALEEQCDLKKENETLKMEIAEARTQLIMQDGEIDKEQTEEAPPSMFSVRLVDCNLPVRVLNVTKAADIDTIGDLVQYSKMDLLKFRCLGKKSISQLDDFVHDLGLEWEMDKAKIYARGMRRIENDSYIERLFRSHLAKITFEIEKKYNLSPAEAIKKSYLEMKRYVECNERNCNE